MAKVLATGDYKVRLEPNKGAPRKTINWIGNNTGQFSGRRTGTMKLRTCGASETGAAAPTINFILAPARQAGWRRHLYSETPEHPAAAAV